MKDSLGEVRVTAYPMDVDGSPKAKIESTKRIDEAEDSLTMDLNTGMWIIKVETLKNTHFPMIISKGSATCSI